MPVSRFVDSITYPGSNMTSDERMTHVNAIEQDLPDTVIRKIDKKVCRESKHVCKL